jgi:hypothetical protein
MTKTYGVWKNGECICNTDFFGKESFARKAFFEGKTVTDHGDYIVIKD